MSTQKTDLRTYIRERRVCYRQRAEAQTRAAKAEEARRDRAARTEANDIIKALPAKIDAALEQSRDCVAVMYIGEAQSLREVCGAGRYVIEHLRQEGLGDQLGVSLDWSGNPSSDNQLTLDLRIT